MSSSSRKAVVHPKLSRKRKRSPGTPTTPTSKRIKTATPRSAPAAQKPFNFVDLESHTPTAPRALLRRSLHCPNTSGHAAKSPHHHLGPHFDSLPPPSPIRLFTNTSDRDHRHSQTRATSSVRGPERLLMVEDEEEFPEFADDPTLLEILDEEEMMAELNRIVDEAQDADEESGVGGIAIVRSRWNAMGLPPVIRTTPTAFRPVRSTEENIEEYLGLRPALSAWLRGHPGASSYGYTLLERNGERTVVLYTPAQVDVSSNPMSLPIFVANGTVKTFEDYCKEPFQPFRYERPGPGSSIGTSRGEGSIGMVLKDNAGNAYALTVARLFEEGPGCIVNTKSKVQSPTSRDQSKARQLINHSISWQKANGQRVIAERAAAKANKQAAKVVEATNEAKIIRDAIMVWTGRKDQLEGDLSFATGYVAEIAYEKEGLHYRTVDWAITSIAAKARVVSENFINIWDETKTWGKGTKDPVAGMRVVKLGRSTGLTFGVVSGVDLQVLLEGNTKETAEWAVTPLQSVDFVELFPQRGGAFEDARYLVTSSFSAAGDSGAVVLEYPTLIPVGLIVGGVDGKVPLPPTYFTPIRAVLRRVKRRLPCLGETIDELLRE